MLLRSFSEENKMRDWSALRQRYLQDNATVQLGGVAANLARISSFSKNAANKAVVFGLLEETKFLIEWTAERINTDVAAQLVDVQRSLALWQLEWDAIWMDKLQLGALARQAVTWSEELLQVSGLLDNEPNASGEVTAELEIP